MADTKISWTNKTWNPVTGCTKISAGCQNCYAERMAKRLAGRFGYPADKPFAVTLRPDKIEEPLRWRKPRMVFVNSMSDLFHEDVPDEFILSVFAVMAKASKHTFQVLTKRAERLPELAPRLPWPDNVWLGVSVENQTAADERISRLVECKAAVQFVSCEPLLGPVDLSHWLGNRECCNCYGRFMESENNGQPDDEPCAVCYTGTAGDIYGVRPYLDWVIVGGESGPGARPMDPDWARSIRDDCRSANIPFFFKQMGGRGKDKGGDMLDGEVIQEFPRLKN